jgi:predicted RNA-binding Zn-ribbon protein involved in translation (DUF1610 family)
MATTWRKMSDHAIIVDFSCPKCGMDNQLMTGSAEVQKDGTVSLMCMGCKGKGWVTLPNWKG